MSCGQTGCWRCRPLSLVSLSPAASLFRVISFEAARALTYPARQHTLLQTIRCLGTVTIKMSTVFMLCCKTNCAPATPSRAAILRPCWTRRTRTVGVVGQHALLCLLVRCSFVACSTLCQDTPNSTALRTHSLSSLDVWMAQPSRATLRVRPLRLRFRNPRHTTCRGSRAFR